VNVSTAEGRAIAEQTIRRLFDQVTSGNGGALGLLKDTGFASVDEFTRFLVGADHALDAFAQQTDAATQALTSLGNVPDVFKRSLDLLRFTTMRPTDATPSVPAPVPLAATPTALPTGVLTGTNGAGAGTTAATPLLVQRFEPGAIQINGTDLTGDEIVDAWERTMRRRATQAAGAGAPLARAWEGL
jgi:hypothetical protein